ncbi:MAG: DUF11 domain-containing protein [Actinobacteria bacterium]|nr:MAG: DUF11 domain-containing protein [Actinomycetota bacterium]
MTIVGCAANLGITKEAQNENGGTITTIPLGGSFNYVITVTNTGNASASPVIVTDNLNDSLTINSTSWDVNPPDTGTDGTCTTGVGNTVSCPSTGTITLAANDGAANGDDTLRVVINVTVPSNLGSCPTLTNSAQVAIGTGNPSTAQSAPVTVTGCAANLTITKAGPATVGQGGAITYTITVKNTGNAQATGVIVTDNLDDSLTGVAGSFDVDPGSAGGTGSCSVSTGNNVSCSVGTLAANDGGANGPDEAVVTITATAPRGQCPTITNQASLTATGLEVPITSNTVTTTVTGCAPPSGPSGGIVVVKGGPAQAHVGDAITYTITVKNTGNAQATGVIVTDNLDDSLTGVAGSFDVDPGSAGGTGSCSVSTGNNVSCSVGTLAANDGGANGPDEAVVTITATAPRGQCPTITNQASLTATGLEVPITSNTVTTTVTGCAPPSGPSGGIVVVKGGPAQAHVGDTITYTFAVSLAAGSASLTNITISDPICSATPTLVSKTGGNQDTTLETGETWNYSCTHVVTATDPDPLPNTVTVTGTGPSGQVSDTDTHSVDIIHPAIKIVKTAKPSSIGPGETVTYTFAVTNTGDVTLFNVKVTDNKLGNICTIDQLAVGETKTCTADFTASSGFGGPLDNVGKAKGHDVTGFSVQDTDTATVNVVLGTTVTPTPVTPPSGVAFTGASGVITLAGLALLLLLLGTGILFFTRRREDGTQT